MPRIPAEEYFLKPAGEAKPEGEAEAEAEADGEQRRWIESSKTSRKRSPATKGGAGGAL